MMHSQLLQARPLCPSLVILQCIHVQFQSRPAFAAHPRWAPSGASLSQDISPVSLPDLFVPMPLHKFGHTQPSGPGDTDALNRLSCAG